MHARLAPAGLLAVALSLQGCSVTDSENVRTAGISAHIDVVSKSSNPNGDTTVTANLQSGSGFNGTDLKLTGGDRLYVTADGARYDLTLADDLVSIYYKARVPSASTHTEYVISFDREEDTSAPSSTVMLPEPFDIEALAKDTYDFDETVTLAWSPGGTGKMVVHYSFDCRDQSGGTPTLFGIRPDIADDGDYQLDLSDILSDQDEPLVACEGELRLKRTRNGNLDPNFGEGGSIEGVQERTVTFDVS